MLVGLHIHFSSNFNLFSATNVYSYAIDFYAFRYFLAVFCVLEFPFNIMKNLFMSRMTITSDMKILK